MSNRYNLGFFKATAKKFAIGGVAKKTKKEKAKDEKRKKAKFIDAYLTRPLKGGDVGKKAGGKYIELEDYYAELPAHGTEEMYLSSEKKGIPKGGPRKRK